MIKEYIKGSILDAPQNYIGHGVNAQNVMGSGVAKVLFDKYPTVKSAYHEQTDYALTMTEYLLGDYHLVEQLDGKVIVNMYTQEYYGRDKTRKYVSYDAIYDSFSSLYASGIKEIAIPKIGCGLANGNWDIVKQIIDDATGDDLDVYVYYLED